MKKQYYFIASMILAIGSLSSCVTKNGSSEKSSSGIAQSSNKTIDDQIKELEQKKRQYESYVRKYGRDIMGSHTSSLSSHRQNVAHEAKYKKLVAETEQKIEALKKKKSESLSK